MRPSKNLHRPSKSKVQLEAESVVAGLGAITNQAKHVFSLPVTDRASSNLKAEHDICADSRDCTYAHFLCRIHKASQIQTKQFDLVAHHVSGLLHTALSMRGGGNRRTLRKLLLEIIEDRLNVYIGEPPEQHRAHREAIFELFLDADASLNEHCKVPAQRREVQKCVLGHFFSGDLQNEDVVEYYASKPMTKSEILKMYERVAIPMLLPTVCPVFARSRWIGGELSIDFAGLLSSIHGLLKPLLQKWGASSGLQPQGRSTAPLEMFQPGWEFVASPPVLPNMSADDGIGPDEAEYDPASWQPCQCIGFFRLASVASVVPLLNPDPGTTGTSCPRANDFRQILQSTDSRF